VIHRGKLLGIVPKAYLPNYREFYESAISPPASPRRGVTSALRARACPSAPQLDNEAEHIIRKAVELTKGGDGPALRVCIDGLLPPRRDRRVAFDMPRIETLADLPKASSALLAAAASAS
jgi:hypothetical protein